MPSEDIVLFTVKKYAKKQPASEQSQAAKQQLASLIRCPHLSYMWLTDVVTSADPSKRLLGCYLQHVRTLVGMRQLPGDVLGQLLDRSEYMKKLLDGAPASWFLPPRTLVREVDHVEVTWVLPMKELKDACMAAFTHDQLQKTKLYSPTTAPLYGMAFKISVVCKGSAGGTTVGLFVSPDATNPSMFVAARSTLRVNARRASSFKYPLQGTNMRGYPDFFEVGCMAGGWDDTAWANQGFPTAGNLEVKLKVTMDKPL